MKPPEGRYVKGSVVLDYVRMIRVNPDLPWSTHLLPEDMELINQMILPGSWYPIEFFQRIGLAVFKLVAGENNMVVQAYGASLADSLHADHPGMVTKDKPRETLDKYIRIQRSFYSFDAFEFEDTGPNRLLVHVFSTPEEAGIPVYMEQISGMIKRLVELSGHPAQGVTVTTAPERGMIKSTIDITWSA